MRQLRRLFAFPLVAVLLVTLACGENTVTAPSTAPSAVPSDVNPGLIGDLLGTTSGLVTGLLACPHDEVYSASKTIGSDGGILRIGPHTLSIPRGALDRPTSISAYAPAGKYVTVTFEPHGLEFDRKSLLSLSTKDCGLLALTQQLFIVYADDDLNILEVLPSVTSLWTRTVSAPIDHFSVYALAD